MGKKNGTGTVGSDQRFLFSKMRIVAGHPGEAGGIAEPRFAGKPVNAAFSGAKRARFQKAACFGCFFFEHALFKGPDIRRFIGRHFILSQ